MTCWAVEGGQFLDAVKINHRHIHSEGDKGGRCRHEATTVEAVGSGYTYVGYPHPTPPP